MPVEKLHRRHLNTEKWDELIAHSNTGTVFCQSWYIDLLTSGNWQAWVNINDKTGEWLAGIPVYEKQKMFNTFSRQPLLSKYWGVQVRRFQAQSAYDTIHYYKSAMAPLVQAATQNAAVFDYFSGIEPVYVPEYQWHGVSVGARFTYMLHLQQGIDELRKGYSKTVRKRINKLKQQGFVNKPFHDFSHVMDMLDANHKTGKQLIPAAAVHMLKGLSKVAYEKQQGFFLSTYSPQNEVVAAGFFIFNQQYTHFLNGYVHPQFRQQNAMNLLVDGALEQAANHSDSFDFYGSSIEGIEAFFRSFGASPTAYYHLLKTKFPFNLIWKI
ncbi:hypothetical protein GC194_12905 [bacterium]|nr:hypothetical protein [bacterium]